MRLKSIRLNKISQMLDYYSNFNPSPLSIKQFLDFGKYPQILRKKRQVHRNDVSSTDVRDYRNLSQL